MDLLNFLSKNVMRVSCIYAVVGLTITFLLLIGVLDISITWIEWIWLHLFTIISVVIYVLCVVARLRDLENKLKE